LSLRPTRWLIELREGLRTQGQYLHAFDDGRQEWSADWTRALRFATKHDAERFGFDHLDRDFMASEHMAVDLVERPDREDALEDAF